MYSIQTHLLEANQDDQQVAPVKVWKSLWGKWKYQMPWHEKQWLVLYVWKIKYNSSHFLTQINRRHSMVKSRNHVGSFKGCFTPLSWLALCIPRHCLKKTVFRYLLPWNILSFLVKFSYSYPEEVVTVYSTFLLSLVSLRYMIIFWSFAFPQMQILQNFGITHMQMVLWKEILPQNCYFF